MNNQYAFLTAFVMALAFINGCGSDSAGTSFEAQVAIISPESEGVTSAESILVVGMALADEKIAKVTVADVEATSDDGYANWEVTVPLSLGTSTLSVNVTSESGAVHEAAAEIVVTRGVSSFDPLGIALDTINNRVLTVDPSWKAVISVDLATGNRTVISSTITGSGPQFSGPYDIALDGENNRVFVTDNWISAIFVVELSGGNRYILSDSTIGAGNRLHNPTGVVLDKTNNRLLVADGLSKAVVAVDLTTGNRTVISDENTGTGDNFSHTYGIELDTANNRVLVTDHVADALIAVDLATGNRTVVSNPSTGSGETIFHAYDIALDAANGRALVTDQGDWFHIDHPSRVISVDLVTGDRTILSVINAGTSIEKEAWSIQLDTGNNRALISDASSSIIAVDLDTGNHTIISDENVGE